VQTQLSSQLLPLGQERFHQNQMPPQRELVLQEQVYYLLQRKIPPQPVLRLSLGQQVQEYCFPLN
jgi:hypothetical protein